MFAINFLSNRLYPWMVEGCGARHESLIEVELVL